MDIRLFANAHPLSLCAEQVAEWLRCLSLSSQGSWVRALQRVKFIIRHMRPIKVCDETDADD